MVTGINQIIVTWVITWPVKASKHSIKSASGGCTPDPSFSAPHIQICSSIPVYIIYIYIYIWGTIIKVLWVNVVTHERLKV